MPDRELRFIPPAQVRSVWPQVLPGLHAIREKTAEPWIPEDVYHALMTGEASLHSGFANGEWVGFVVMTTHEFYGRKSLHVWCAYAKTDLDPVALFLPLIQDIARSAGLERVRFISPRGWERRLNVNPVAQIFEMEV